MRRSHINITRLLLTDQGSANGTWHLARGPPPTWPRADGDLIRCGGTTIFVRLPVDRQAGVGASVDDTDDTVFVP